MTTLQKIVAKAKIFYKSGKYQKWTDAIKAASTTISKTTKKAVKKVKKTITKKAKVRSTKNKLAPKKKVAKSYHKDTKSHNVRINVMSGSSQKQTLIHLLREKEITENKLPTIKMLLKQETDVERKKHYKFWINRYTKYLSGLKKQISEAKKHI
jgi:hypothetical protein